MTLLPVSPGSGGRRVDVGDGGIPLDEYVVAKRVLIDLSRSSMLYAKPQLASIEALAEIKEERLQKCLLELNCELDEQMERLGLDPAEQLRELTAAISTTKHADAACTSKEDLLALLSVASEACSKLDEHVAPAHFVAAARRWSRCARACESSSCLECIPY